MQGDKEKSLGLPYSPFSERGLSLEQMQINFTDFVVLPLLRAVERTLPELGKECIPQLLENRANWISLKELVEEAEAEAAAIAQAESHISC